MAIHHLSITLPRCTRDSALGSLSGCRSSRASSDSPEHLVGMNTQELGLEPLMGVEELAEYLGVPVQTIYDWRVAGTAPRAFKFGKRLKFAVADVIDWMRAHREVGDE